MTTDAERDAEVERWNAALAGGDEDEIERVKRETLDALHRRQLEDWNPQGRTR
jgi:hypothetical protein